MVINGIVYDLWKTDFLPKRPVGVYLTSDALYMQLPPYQVNTAHTLEYENPEQKDHWCQQDCHWRWRENIKREREGLI